VIWQPLYYPRATRTELKLRSFSELPQGWHYGRGGPIASDVLELTARIYNDLLILGLSRTDVFPDPAGGVLLTAYQGSHYVGIDVGADLSLSLVHEDDDEECCHLHDANLREIKRALAKVADEIWGMFVSSTQSFGRPIVGASVMSPTESHPAAVFRSSASSALRLQVA